MSRGLIVSTMSTLEMGSPSASAAPMWLIRALKVKKTRIMQSVHEEMVILTEVVTTTPTPVQIPPRMTYLASDKQDDLVSKIAIPPLHAKIDTVAAEDFTIQEVILGKPTKDIA